MTGNVDTTPATPGGLEAQWAYGVWPDAPLGTNPAYHVQPASAAILGHSAAKAGSALEPDEIYSILAATLTLADTTEADVDWDAEGLSFEEGAQLSCWLKYEVAPSCTYDRRWQIEETGLDYTETVTEVNGGTYVVSFDYTLPYLDGVDTLAAVQKCTLSMPKLGSSILIVDPGIAEAHVPFFITKVPVIPYHYSEHEAQMGWEDLIVDSDYDYNDLINWMKVTEHRRISDGKLVQIDLWVKAIARGAGYDGAWQFNIDGAFPGTTCTAYVDQYYADGTPHGAQRIWTSREGASVPVFTSNKVACPKPPESYATNTVKDTTFVDGDYAEVTILLDTPLDPGSYTPMPYKPQLRVYANNGSVYMIGLWTRRGDPVDLNGQPLAFIIPGTYAWPMEGRQIWLGYPRFNDWVAWVNNLALGEELEPQFWNDPPQKLSGSTYNVYDRALFKPYPPPQ